MDDIKGALQQVLSPSFEISIGDVGFFTPRKPRIFWAGVHAQPELEQLVAKVDATLAQVGIPQDKEEYHPHITLARTGSGRPAGAKSDRNQPWLLGLKNAIAEKPEFSNPRFGTMMPQEFFLFRSETLPEGARYTKLASFPLR